MGPLLLDQFVFYGDWHGRDARATGERSGGGTRAHRRAAHHYRTHPLEQVALQAIGDADGGGVEAYALGGAAAYFHPIDRVVDSLFQDGLQRDREGQDFFGGAGDLADFLFVLDAGQHRL